MKTRGKNKDTGGKIKTGEKNIIYFPQLKYSAQIFFLTVLLNKQGICSYVHNNNKEN
jgi:hypothetical protein